MSRLEKNKEILDLLRDYLERNPTIRFGQALSNFNLATHRDEKQGINGDITWMKNIFYEEPEETLTKMRNL